MTFTQLRRECVKRNLWLEEYQGGFLVSDLETNAVAIPDPPNTLETVEAWIADIEPQKMSDDEVERAIEKIEEREQEAGGND